MLDIVRKYSKSPVAKAILLAVAASFFIGFSILTAVWRSCSIKGLHGNVARAGRWYITPRDFSMAYSRMLEISREREEFKNLDENLLREMVLQSLINSWLIATEAEKVGYVVSEDELNAEIRKILRITGNLDKKQYLEFLARNRLFPEEFEKRLKLEILSSKILDLIKEGILISEEELWTDYELENTKISLYFVKFDPAQEMVKVTEEKIKEYYEAHKDEFKGPEKRLIRYTFVERGEKEDEEVFRKRVEEIAKEMGEKGFEKVCGERSLVYSETPPFERDKGLPVELPSPQEVVEKTFNLTEGGIGGPIFSEGRALLFKLQGIISSAPLTFEEAIPRVREKISEIERKEMAKGKASALIEKIKGEREPARKALRLGYRVEETEPFSLYAAEIKGIGQAKELVISAWLLNENRKVSENPVFFNNAFYVLMLKDIEKPVREEFERKKAELMKAHLDEYFDIIQRDLLLRMRSIYPVEIDRKALEGKEEGF